MVIAFFHKHHFFLMLVFDNLLPSYVPSLFRTMDVRVITIIVFLLIRQTPPHSLGIVLFLKLCEILLF